MKKYLVIRSDGSKRIVGIMIDRATNKYCFVNLTTGHVCSCRFDTFEDALNDMDINEKVSAYFKLPNEKDNVQ